MINILFIIYLTTEISGVNSICLCPAEVNITSKAQGEGRHRRSMDLRNTQVFCGHELNQLDYGPRKQPIHCEPQGVYYCKQTPVKKYLLPAMLSIDCMDSRHNKKACRQFVEADLQNATLKAEIGDDFATGRSCFSAP